MKEVLPDVDFHYSIEILGHNAPLLNATLHPAPHEEQLTGDLSWSVNDEGLLRIWFDDSLMGDGEDTAIPDYTSYTATPWYTDYKDVITALRIESGVTSIGRYAFSHLTKLRTIDIAVTQAKGVLEEPAMDITGADITPKHFDIELKNVSFAYESRRIIDNVSLRIPEKTTTAIVGPSGGGKTTLTSLIARFWDVQEGEVLLNGRNVKEYSFDSLMRNFSFVFQRVYLFEDTIANNIRFGEPEASMERVIEAAKKACCHDFIMQLPDGYETVIGEGGASLSGGEKQRISIARAILKDSPIIILDEATANVDPENEAELVKAVQELTRNKTIIMIAHRLKTVRNADQILVIDQGRIAQQGTHEQLMKKDGIYRRFVSERSEAASWKIA